MKALALDSAVTKLTIAAKNEEHTVTAVYDIGMKQSETLLPAIDYVLEKASLSKSELETLIITRGPGSFTGLRLSFSALKALELAYNIPLYGISTLDCYAESYKNLPFIVLSVIDAKKDKFYAKAFDNSKTLIEEGDYEENEIIFKLNDIKEQKDILICGSDSELLFNKINGKIQGKNIYFVPFCQNSTDMLFKIAEDMKNEGKLALNEYDGPVYLRASEAEVKLGTK